MTKSVILEERPDLSLVLGGPLFQLYRRARLAGDAGELLHRRVLVITSVAWVPLLLLSAFSGHALGGSIKVPFLHDIEAHARFLVALPILIVAELFVHLRSRPVVEQFVERRIVIPEEIPKFQAAINSTLRMRNAVIVEVTLLVLVYTMGLWVWRSRIALGEASWYALPDGTQLHLTLAGYWYVFVSLPIFQFLLVRWYLRFFSGSGFCGESQGFVCASLRPTRIEPPGSASLAKALTPSGRFFLLRALCSPDSSPARFSLREKI